MWNKTADFSKSVLLRGNASSLLSPCQVSGSAGNLLFFAACKWKEAACPLPDDVLSFLSLSLPQHPLTGGACALLRLSRFQAPTPHPLKGDSSATRPAPHPSSTLHPLLSLRGLGPLIYSDKAAQKKERGDGRGEGGSRREQTLVPSSSARWKRQRSAAKEQLTHCGKSIYFNYLLHFDMLPIKLLE